MRWDDLFDDLAAQYEAEQDDLDAEVADRSRRESARVRLVDRLRANIGRPLVVTLPGQELRGALVRVGADCFLLSTGPGVEVLVPTEAVAALRGLSTSSAEPGSEGAVASRLGLGHALRAIARDRAGVQAVTIDGSAVTGRIERVGADHLELARLDPDDPTVVRELVYVPFSALACVRSAGYA